MNFLIFYTGKTNVPAPTNDSHPQSSMMSIETASLQPTLVHDETPQSMVTATIASAPSIAAPMQQASLEPLQSSSDVVDVEVEDMMLAVASETNDRLVGKNKVDVSSLLTSGIGSQANQQIRPKNKPNKNGRIPASEASVKMPSKPVVIPTIPRNAKAQSYVAAFVDKASVGQLRQKNDGIDHINIGGGARTKLGKGFGHQWPSWLSVLMKLGSICFYRGALGLSQV